MILQLILTTTDSLVCFRLRRFNNFMKLILRFLVHCDSLPRLVVVFFIAVSIYYLFQKLLKRKG